MGRNFSVTVGRAAWEACSAVPLFRSYPSNLRCAPPYSSHSAGSDGYETMLPVSALQPANYKSGARNERSQMKKTRDKCFSCPISSLVITREGASSSE
jgi:hypothetical protein